MTTQTFVQNPATNYPVITWAAMSAGDDGATYEPSADDSLAGSIQFTGGFTGAAVLQGSNDGTNWVTLRDTRGVDISTTSAAAFEFSSAMRYLRPTLTGGSNTCIPVLSLRA